MSRGVSWLNPPPCVVIGGSESFLVDREIRNAVLLTEKAGRTVVRSSSDAEAADAISAAETLGVSSLIVSDWEDVSSGTVSSIQASQPKKTCLLIRVEGSPAPEKSSPILSLVEKNLQVFHNTPGTKKGVRELAVRFVKSEAASLTGNKEALEEKLADALVGAVGTDLGVLSWEILKAVTLASAEGRKTLSPQDIRSVMRVSTELDMSPLREALASRDRKRVCSALEKIRNSSSEDPVMLLLRARGGPADLVMTWLQVSLLLEKGVTSSSEIASRLSQPEWAISKEAIPAARKWGSSPLRRLLRLLSLVDRGVLKGSPAPWVSCEAALLKECF